MRKNFNPSRGPGLPANPGHSPYLLKEHREGEKGEKILVLVHFSESRPEERGHRGEERTGDQGLLLGRSDSVSSRLALEGCSGFVFWNGPVVRIVPSLENSLNEAH